jgi:hypothetical protein
MNTSKLIVASSKLTSCLNQSLCFCHGRSEQLGGKGHSQRVLYKRHGATLWW